ncbi:MAG: hypothetical protein P8074_06950 [Anaerolineales bacterium]|jgi:hypothetical protein
MQTVLKWLSENKFRMHLLAFSVMILAPIALYFAAQGQSAPWIWVLIALFAAANLLVIAVR